jgi:hypothetical protein
MRGIAAALIPLNRLKPFEGCRLRVLSASATRRLRRSVRKGSLDIPQEGAHSAFSGGSSVPGHRRLRDRSRSRLQRRRARCAIPPRLSLFRIISSMTCTRPSTWSAQLGCPPIFVGRRSKDLRLDGFPARYDDRDVRSRVGRSMHCTYQRVPEGRKQRPSAQGRPRISAEPLAGDRDPGYASALV